MSRFGASNRHPRSRITRENRDGLGGDRRIADQHDPNMGDRFFPYDFDLRFAWIWRPLGVRPGVDGVTIGADGTLIATFGRFRVETMLSNVKDAKLTGPYRWWKAVGIRGSGADSGITFGTTPRGGVCILFFEPVPQVLPTARSHEGLTVTVLDRQGLIATVRQG